MDNEQKKILIVEDDLFISEVYLTKLSSEGFNVTIAENGESALEKIEKVHPDVILLDILMPKMDGWEVLSNIRKRENGGKEAIVIMLTNVGDKEAINKALKAGANDYFIKSFFTPEEVVVKIRGLLDKNKTKK